MRKMIEDIKKRSLFNYILSFSAIVVLILLVMGAYLYRFYYRTIYNDFVASNETYLTSIEYRHENDMDIVGDIVTQVSLSKNTMNFVLNEKPVKSIALKEQLYQYVAVSQFFHQIFFLYHGDTYLYNHTTSIELGRFLKEGLILDMTSPQELSDLLYSKENGMKILREQKVDGYLATKFHDVAEQVVLYIVPVAPKNNSTLVFAVGNTYYDELLSSEEKELRQNYIILNQEVIVSRGNLNLEENMILDQLLQQNSEKGIRLDQSSDTDGVHRVLKLNGTKYLVAVKQGDSGLTYCTVQSMKIFQDKIVTEQWGILFLLLVCSLPASLAIVTLSRHLSDRVKCINVLLNKEEESYYDLNNIEIGIRTLVESNREVNKENLPLRRTKFVSSFIRGEYQERSLIIAAGKKAGLQIDRACFVVILMGDRGNSNESKAYLSSSFKKCDSRPKPIRGRTCDTGDL